MPRIHVVSDVHGRVDGLVEAGSADALVCLGDLLSFVDYADPSQGVLGRTFGGERVAEFIGLRTDLRFAEARELSRSWWRELDEPPAVVMDREVRRQYAELFGAFAEVAAAGTPVLLMHGNDDLPDLWPDYLVDGVRPVDGEVVEVAGTAWGFVGGVLPSPVGGVSSATEADYDSRLAGLPELAAGAIDVIATHIPPELPWLVYDTVARRYEHGSRGLLSLLHRVQPRWSVFGHVHQPLSPHASVGRTQCANVGHFRATGSPFVLHL